MMAGLVWEAEEKGACSERLSGVMPGSGPLEQWLALEWDESRNEGRLPRLYLVD